MARSGERVQLRNLLLQVIGEFNASVPDERELRRRLDSEPVGKKHGREAGQRWRTLGRALAPFHAARRAYYAELFQTSGTKGRPSKNGLESLVKRLTRIPKGGQKRPALRLGLRVTSHADAARVVVDWNVTNASRWDYAALRLAMAGDVDFRIIACRQCRRLRLIERGGKGRPVTKYCSPACGNANRQKKHRSKTTRKLHA